MFAVGDLIVYSETGVCRVEQVGPPPFDPKTKREYYTLSPLNCRETIYVPVDTRVFMRPILSREAAEELIDRLPEIQQARVDCQDYRVLAQQYRGFLETHRCEDLVQLISWFILKISTRAGQGKSPARWIKIIKSGLRLCSTGNWLPRWGFRWKLYRTISVSAFS